MTWVAGTYGFTTRADYDREVARKASAGATLTHDYIPPAPAPAPAPGSFPTTTTPPTAPAPTSTPPSWSDSLTIEQNRTAAGLPTYAESHGPGGIIEQNRIEAGLHPTHISPGSPGWTYGVANPDAYVAGKDPQTLYGQAWEGGWRPGYDADYTGGDPIPPPDPEMERLYAMITQLEAELMGQQKPMSVQEILSLVQGVAPMPELRNILGFDEATHRATAELSPLWDVNLRQALEAQQHNLMGRGFYGQLPGDELMMGTMGDVESQRAHAIGGMANQLVGRDEDQAMQLLQTAMQGRGQDIDMGMGAVQHGQAGQAEYMRNLLAMYQGVGGREQDLWQRDFDVEGRSIEQQQFAQTLGISDRLAAVQEGTLDLSSAMFEFEQDVTKLDQAMSRTRDFGEVKTAADAALIGVPVGTDTWAAQDAVDQRKAWLGIEQSKLGLGWAELRHREAVDAAAAARAEAGDVDDNFRNALAAWQAGGVATQQMIDQGLGSYGIQVDEIYDPTRHHEGALVTDTAGTAKIVTDLTNDIKKITPGTGATNDSYDVMAEAIHQMGGLQQAQANVQRTMEVARNLRGTGNYPQASEPDLMSIQRSLWPADPSTSPDWWKSPIPPAMGTVPYQ